MFFKTKNLNSDTVKIFVTGRLDTNSAHIFHEKMAEVSPDIKNIILDFYELSYISSAGLREIIILKKKFSNFQIINVHPVVYEVFSITGFDKFIKISVFDENVSQKSFVNRGITFEKFLSKKVEKLGDKIIFEGGGEKYSWRDIDNRANVIANDLTEKNIGRGDRVAICGANSINWIITFFAVQKLGAIAVLMNFNLCANEISELNNYSDIKIFCHGEMAANISEIENAKNFYSFKDVNFNRPAKKIENKIFSDDPCVMIFTSGTTGKSKGVILSAYNILNAAKINSADQTLIAEDKICIILPFFHIFGLVAGIFANAWADSKICLPDKIRTENILNLIVREKCTIFHSVPTMLIAMINNKNFTAEKVSSLRCTIISGAAATEAQIKNFKKNMPNNHFFASYGLSEMAPVSITNYDDPVEKTLQTVGKPVKNIEIKIFNPNAEGIGEILVKGFNMMLGYYKIRPEDQPIDEEGFLHTGDLGKIDAENYLHLTGRSKDIIIRGGENIYPAEIERIISEYKNIVDVKVVGVPHEFFGEEVCACIKINSEIDIDALKNFLSNKIAKFKIPSHFLIYEKFPVLGSGKIDAVSLKKDAIKKING